MNSKFLHNLIRSFTRVDMIVMIALSLVSNVGVSLSTQIGPEMSWVELPVYTFLQSDTGTLQLKVTAYSEYTSSTKTVVLERSFENIPVERLKETIVSGDFFEHESDNSFSFVAETGWEVHERISY